MNRATPNKGYVNSRKAIELLGTTDTSLESWRKHGYIRAVKRSGQFRNYWYDLASIKRLKKQLDQCDGMVDAIRAAQIVGCREQKLKELVGTHNVTRRLHPTRQRYVFDVQSLRNLSKRINQKVSGYVSSAEAKKLARFDMVMLGHYSRTGLIKRIRHPKHRNQYLYRKVDINKLNRKRAAKSRVYTLIIGDVARMLNTEKIKTLHWISLRKIRKERNPVRSGYLYHRDDVQKYIKIEKDRKKKFLNTTEVLQRLGISIRTLNNWRRWKYLKRRKFSLDWCSYYSRDQVNQFKQSNEYKLFARISRCLTTPEAAKHLGISLWKLEQIVQNGLIQPVEHPRNGRLYFTKAEVRKAIKSLRSSS